MRTLAACAPVHIVSYGVFGVFVAAIELLAQPAVASAVLQWPEIVAQLVFTPLVAALSIWTFFVVLLILNIAGVRVVAPLCNRERLITGTKS